jgi:hypothetical protein
MSSDSQEFCAGGIVYRQACQSDDADLRETLRNNPMPSWVTMSLEREPSYFDGEDILGKSFTVMARKDDSTGDPIGSYTCNFGLMHINGRIEHGGYLGGLRIHQPYRNKIRVLKNGFASIQKLMPEIPPPTCWFTSIAKENASARRLLEAGIKDMPVYQCIGELETLAIDISQAKPGNLLQRLQPEDIPALVKFFNAQAARYQFSTALTENWLLHLTGQHGLRTKDFRVLKIGTEIHACLALWDQRRFKQTVAQGYHPLLRTLRQPFNHLARARGRVRLPAPGKRLESIFIAFAAFDETAHYLAVKAIREVMVEVRNANTQVGIIGLSTRNPLLKKLQSQLRATTYRSCIETVTWPDQVAPRIDKRPPQPEVALL